MQSAPTAQIKDSRGRTLAQDLNDNLLPPPVTESLDKLREEVRAKAYDEAAIENVLDRAEPILTNQIVLGAVIALYFGRRSRS